jgi:hypothetical protein
MIQSKQPPEGPMIDHCRVPLVTMLMVIKVETVSPDNKHPELTPCGLVLGFEIEPDVKSIVL